MTADTIGGVWTYALELARGLTARRIEVHLATMGQPLDAAQRAGAAAISGLYVHESAYKLEWMDDPWGDVAAAGDWLLELEAALRPDIVHLNGYSHGALPWRAPVMIVAHSCVLSWWRAVKGCDAPAEWATYRARVREGLLGAALVVAPTRAMLDALRACHGAIGAARVIANGRDPGHFAAGPKEDLVLAAGRMWDEAKNLAALEACAPALPWPVCVAGPVAPPGLPGAQHEHARGVTFLGSLAPGELARWLGRAAIFALPARYEPFGLSALEAALSGCALVLGDIPSLREVWGSAAIFVAPGEPDALGRAITGLVSDGRRRAFLAARARARALSLSADRMVRGYSSAYRALLEREPAERAPAAARQVADHRV